MAKLRTRHGWKESPHGTFTQNAYKIVYTPFLARDGKGQSWAWEARERLDSGRIKRFETPSGKRIRFRSEVEAMAFFELVTINP